MTNSVPRVLTGLVATKEATRRSYFKCLLGRSILLISIPKFQRTKNTELAGPGISYLCQFHSVDFILNYLKIEHTLRSWAQKSESADADDSHDNLLNPSAELKFVSVVPKRSESSHASRSHASRQSQSQTTKRFWKQQKIPFSG